MNYCLTSVVKNVLVSSSSAKMASNTKIESLILWLPYMNISKIVLREVGPKAKTHEHFGYHDWPPNYLDPFNMRNNRKIDASHTPLKVFRLPQSIITKISKTGFLDTEMFDKSTQPVLTRVSFSSILFDLSHELLGYLSSDDRKFDISIIHYIAKNFPFLSITVRSHPSAKISARQKKYFNFLAI